MRVFEVQQVDSVVWRVYEGYLKIYLQFIYTRFSVVKLYNTNGLGKTAI